MAPVLDSTDDEVLEAMMAEHRSAMLMLREAAYYQLLRQGDRFDPCRAHIPSKAECWIRFRCTLRAQLMDLQVDSIDCNVPNDPQLLPCVREQLSVRDPIGIPMEAATELGDYVGPLEVAWYVK